MRGGPGGCTSLRLACPGEALTGVCVRIHLRIPGSAKEARRKPNHPTLNARSSVLHDWGAEAHGPGPRLLAPSQLGQRQHSHTGSICDSIAPHGRARPRAVTQMALGDFQMTHRPPSVSPPQGPVPFTGYQRDINPTLGDE